VTIVVLALAIIQSTLDIMLWPVRLSSLHLSHWWISLWQTVFTF